MLPSGLVGTWTIADDALWLVHLNAFSADEVTLTPQEKARFLKLIPAPDFPLRADWFSGRLKIQLGTMLLYSHHGLSSIYEACRFVTLRKGRVIRDRVVDTGKMVERRKRRDPRFAALMAGDSSGSAMLFPAKPEWSDDASDWWPPGFEG